MKIIPKPSKIEMLEGVFVFSAATEFIGASELIKNEILFLDFEAAAKNQINFVTKDTSYEYEIIIDKNITVSAKDGEGAFHAAMTLKQLIFEYYADGVAKLPFCKISDSPTLNYRGFMLDVSRHFFGAETIKKLLDMLALCKMNIFHWHLSDNQGYRIESKKYPLLNEIASKSKASVRGGTEKTEFFTEAQITEIVKYAKERFIEVIPEIDLPGHTLAFLATYPELGCKNERPEIASRYNIDSRIICAGKENTYDFTFNLLDEVCTMFESKRFHIGGDEVPKSQWNACPACREKIKSEGIKNSEQLQGYFTNRVINHLKKHDKTAIVWNEALKSDMLDDSATVQYWMDGADNKHVKKAAAQNRKIIVSKNFNYYLDYAYGMCPLKKTYSYDPLKLFRQIGAEKSVIGVEAPLWGEWIKTEDRLFYQAFPRLFAVAESGWYKGEKNYADFEDRLDNILGIMLAYGYNFATVKRSNPSPIWAPISTAAFFAQFAFVGKYNYAAK